MHVIFRESHGLEETTAPFDVGQSPADLVVLSYSDSDLGAFAGGWHRAAGALPTLRLANLVALRHPLSVDTYIDATLSGAKGILIRLIGGESYWSYGLQQVHDLARRRGIALAVLPGDGREDARLEAFSTVPLSRPATTPARQIVDVPCGCHGAAVGAQGGSLTAIGAMSHAPTWR